LQFSVYIVVVLLLSSGVVRAGSKSTNTSRIYGWYLSAVCTQLHFRHKLWGTRGNWKWILYHI